MLVFKGYQDLEETKMVWKQRPHVLKYFEDPSDSKDDISDEAFIEKFLHGYQERQFS